MYLQLSKIYFAFEKILDAERKYFDMIDYQIYSEDERKDLINADARKENDFILIPQIDRNKIVAKYLIEKNNRKLLREKEDEYFYNEFRRYIEGNRLVEDWNHFEKAELIAFASEWCALNQIKCSAK